jgi:hypothetical protein
MSDLAVPDGIFRLVGRDPAEVEVELPPFLAKLEPRHPRPWRLGITHDCVDYGRVAREAPTLFDTNGERVFMFYRWYLAGTDPGSWGASHEAAIAVMMDAASEIDARLLP